MGLFKLSQAGPSGPYETKFDIDFEKPVTLNEFLNEVLSNTKEWGDVTVNDNSSIKYVEGFSYHPSFYIEYKYGKFTHTCGEVFNEHQLNLIVTKANCISGYSRTDYNITIG